MNKWIKDLETLSTQNQNIKESEILILIPQEIHCEWDKFMRGKTCPILENGDHGVYSWDLKQFLNNF